MDSKAIIKSVAVILTGISFATTVNASTNKQETSGRQYDQYARDVAARNFKVPADDTRVAIVVYVKDEVKNGVVYETERPVKVFETKYQAEQYIKEHEDIHQYKRGLYAGELRIRFSHIER